MSTRGKTSIGIISACLVALAVVVYVFTLSPVEATEQQSDQATQSSASSDTDDQAQEATPEDSDKEEDEKAPIPIEVAVVELGSVTSYLTASANLVPEADVKVLAEAQGRVDELLVEEGDAIAADQRLAVLNREEAEIARNKAVLRATNAEAAFSRAGETLEQGLISKEEYDRLRMQHDVAQQEVAEAEYLLSKTVIRAPFGGRVTERFVKPGQHVRPGDVLFSVADFDPLIARIYLPEKEVLTLAEGRRVRITLVADEMVAFEGKIAQISPIVDTATGTVKVTVQALRHPAQVRPGAFVTIGIVREQRDNVVIVPRESVIRELRSTHVFVQDGDEAVKRAVSLGLEEGDTVEITQGLTAGEHIVVAGQGGLKQGTKIKVI